jgi:hypothetical protein
MDEFWRGHPSRATCGVFDSPFSFRLIFATIGEFLLSTGKK